MRLKQPFLKLPIRFDAEALAAEVRALPPSAWTPHPTGFVGNEAVRLISPDGAPTDDIEGPMAATPHLEACAYVRQIMEEIGAVWGRSRFMGLAAGSEVPPHIDINYYWRTHHRIHIPVITNPGVEFTCGSETVHMAAGECWAFDSFRWHDVQNKGADQRIHLVIDTVGGGILPELMDAAASGSRAEGRLFRPGERAGTNLRFEHVNAPSIMSPWEMRCHLEFVKGEAPAGEAIRRALEPMDKLVEEWTAVWAEHGTDPAGVPAYTKLLERAYDDTVRQLPANGSLVDGPLVREALEGLIFAVALSAKVRKAPAHTAATPTVAAPSPDGEFRPRFNRPIFIVGTPRSGSNLLYETLENAPALFTAGNEAHWLIEELPGLAPNERVWSSNRLSAEDITAERAERLSRAYYETLTDRDGKSPDGRARMLEKTPKNSLRTLFFDALWPDAQFVYLYRDVRQTFTSMLEAWRTGGFVTYPQLPSWRGPPWSMLLVPGWQQLNGLPLPEIVAHQWATTTEKMLDDLEQIDPARVHVIEHAALLASPAAEVKRLTGALGLEWDRPIGPALPLSKATVSPPDPHKWRRIEPVIREVWPILERADARARAFVEVRSPSPPQSLAAAS